MGKQYSVQLKDDLSELIKLEKSIKQFSEEHALPDHLSYYINLVCEEVFVNAITHGKDKTDSHIDILITLDIKDHLLTISVQDNSLPFNLLEEELPNVHLELDQRLPGGLGVFLIRQWANNIHYRREKNKNVLTLEKMIE